MNCATNDINASQKQPDFCIFTDASMTGWGCAWDKGRTGGNWKEEEAKSHINVLELKAGLLSLQSFVKDMSSVHVRLMMDNTTAVACLNKMGTSHSRECNIVTKEIWNFCIEKNIWLSAAYVPGKENVCADLESRKINTDAEWKLNPEILNIALEYLKYVPDVDLFASRLNFQFPNYVAYRPDPLAKAVDAFSLSWKNLQFYAFPPFSVIPSMLQKILVDKARGVVVLPNWPSQPWYALLMRMMVEIPILVSARNNLLIMPAQPKLKHRLKKSLNLLICKVSGHDTESMDFRSKQPTYYAQAGDQEHIKRMTVSSRNGKYIVVDKKLMKFHLL